MAGEGEARYTALARRLVPGGELLGFRDLEGGVSAAVTVLEVRRADGPVERLIVRRHGSVDLLRNPHAARDGAPFSSAFSIRADSPSPRRSIDQSREIFPTPLLAVTYVEGSMDECSGRRDRDCKADGRLSRPDTSHRCMGGRPGIPRHLHDEVRMKLAARPAHLDRSLDEERIRDTLEAWWPLQRSTLACCFTEITGRATSSGAEGALRRSSIGRTRAWLSARRSGECGAGRYCGHSARRPCASSPNGTCRLPRSTSSLFPSGILTRGAATRRQAADLGTGCPGRTPHAPAAPGVRERRAARLRALHRPAHGP